MNFDKAVSDDPVFPTEELPKDRLYRPDLGDPNASARGYKSILVCAVIIFSYIGLSYTYSFSLSFLEMLLGCLCLLFMLVIGLFYYFQRPSQQISRVHEIIGLTAQGKLSEAAKLADDIARIVQPFPYLNCYALYERAAVASLQGDYSLAIGICGAITRSNALAKPNNPLHIYWGLNMALLANNYACIGKIQQAEQWLTYARRFVPDDWRGALIGTDLIVGIHTGRAAVVVADTERDWAYVEAVLRVKSIRTIRMLCAFGLSRINTDGTKTEAINRWLASLHPHTPGEFNNLAKHWPELQAFIEEKKL